MVIAVGDIHGQVHLLHSLISQVDGRLSSSDTLVFLGDYIDRGPGSSAVIEFLCNLESPASLVFLRGNHEELMLAARDGFKPVPTLYGLQLADGDPMREWLPQGGAETLASYAFDVLGASDSEYIRWREVIPESHWKFLERTSPEFVVGPNKYVHAGVMPPGKWNWEYDGLGLDPRLWIREPFLSYSGTFEGKRIVFGHSPQPEPLIEPHKIGLDTGAAFGGPLTAGIFDSSGDLIEIVQARP